MMSIRAALAVSASLAVVTPVFAETIDMSRVSCQDFVKSSPEKTSLYLTWLMGYYASEDDETKLDFDKMKESGAKIAAYCRDNPKAGLLDAAKAALNRGD